MVTSALGDVDPRMPFGSERMIHALAGIQFGQQQIRILMDFHRAITARLAGHQMQLPPVSALARFLSAYFAASRL